MPDANLVLERLRSALLCGGVVTLDADDESDRSSSLQVRIEGGRFLLTFGWDDGFSWKMKVFVHPDSEHLVGQSSLLGDVWLNRIIFSDQKVVVEAFMNFLNGVHPAGDGWI